MRSSYDLIHSYSHAKKRQLFPIISAYIREMTDRDELVKLSMDDLETIANSPNIPMTIEEKGSRLLQYMYRHSKGPGEPVVIQPLAHSYNLTYSPNLQELVYIIDQLRNDQFIVREGMTFKLTDKGWSEAAARAGGRKLKPCSVLLGDDHELSAQWSEQVLPRIEQCGYQPILVNHSNKTNRDNDFTKQISESKLIIADLTSHSPEVYFAAGYALGMNIPVIFTVKRSHLDQVIPSHQIRPLAWDTAEELAAMLQQKLSYHLSSLVK
ncbi:hypothetical protein [Paenibacillus sediminis]|uniref:Nucleoside 2-deoxyribosyltransferase n=1 Tax=Paenibacillus sediminis TaxID=664909 RepID=A0ABS4H0L9_9BACL|nr:hypothetical protein [Paenibacillus sediminis]MBP1936073.1 hypothetical protein [Paenibacillus sediminis]